MGFASKKELAAMKRDFEAFVPTQEAMDFSDRIIACVEQAVAEAKARREAAA
jgi:hypothetical protein